MDRRPPFDYDISVTADKLRRARRRGLTGEFGTGARPCEHPGCGGSGLYRAPRSRDALDEFLWLCLDHVRDYNRSWNFYGNLEADELERQIEADRLWGRPTWPLGDGPGGGRRGRPSGEGQAWRRLGYVDPLEILGPNATINPGRPAAGNGGHPRRLPRAERLALEVLGARDDMTKTEIRRLYKDLVKQLHPDTNGGSRADEARLQQVFWAWEQIRASHCFAA
jgi:hypothetical protein